MGSPIIFFNKSKLDISNSNVEITADNGQSYVDYLRNRNNTSAWVTTGSVDADLTEIEFNFGETRSITDILLIKHNFKAFTVKYWNGSAWTAFSTPIAETTNTKETNWYQFTEVDTTKLQLIIQGTQTANEDKFMYQFIATTQMGQLEGWPMITGVEHDRNRTKTQALSGKMSVNENIGGFRCKLSVPHYKIIEDLEIIEAMYEKNEGFLVWLCGGSESQFYFAAKGYRLEDIYLMKCSNEYNPDYAKGIYINGLEIKIQLDEVID